MAPQAKKGIIDGEKYLKHIMEPCLLKSVSNRTCPVEFEVYSTGISLGKKGRIVNTNLNLVIA